MVETETPACPVCELREQVGVLTSQREADRKRLKQCWVRGGALNDTDETTIVTIDAYITPEQKSKLFDLLRAIDAKR